MPTFTRSLRALFSVLGALHAGLLGAGLLWASTPERAAGLVTRLVALSTPARKALDAAGAAAVSAGNTVAVAIDRATGRVAVQTLDRGGQRVAREVEVDVGRGSEPWAVVIGKDGDSAYLALRDAHQVVRIRDLRGRPTLEARSVRTGVEPTGLALSPSGARLYVANFADGTVTVIDTARMAAVGSFALEGGPTPAHPRALAVTDDGDGDDADETVYVTEFFSQAPDRRSGQGRRALVHRFATRDGAPGAPIALAPADCVANQLSAATLDGGRLLVKAVCESERSAAGRPTVLVVDLPPAAPAPASSLAAAGPRQ